MQKEVRDNLRVEDIAAQLNLSGEHFSRLFHREVSLPPHQYFLQLKVQDASGMLISTAKTVGQIADYFGFENQFHFSRVFKKCTGLSPLQYRRSYLQMADFVPRDDPPDMIPGKP
jgi:AraC-like DNA-binding protein